MNRLSRVLIGFLCLGIASGAEEGGRLLTRVAEVRELTHEAAEQGLPVRLECVVLVVTPSGAFVHDGDSSIWVENATAAAKSLWQEPPPEDFGPGSVILLDGKTVPGGYAPSVRPTAMRFLRRGELPAPRHPSMQFLVTGSEDCQWIELEGVVQDAALSTYSRQTFFTLETGGHRFGAVGGMEFAQNGADAGQGCEDIALCWTPLKEPMGRTGGQGNGS